MGLRTPPHRGTAGGPGRLADKQRYQGHIHNPGPSRVTVCGAQDHVVKRPVYGDSARNLIGRRVGQEAVCWTGRKVATWVGSMDAGSVG